jgi:single-strand DNA-binding protein
MALNKVLLIGNVGKEPDVRHTEGGATVANFTLATSEKYKDRTSGELKELTEWHNIVAWRQLADLVENYIHKGTQIYVEGRLRTRSYEQNGQKRYITEIMADSIQLLGRKGENAPSSVNALSPETSQDSRSNYSHQSPKSVKSDPNSIVIESLDSDGNDDLPF